MPAPKVLAALLVSALACGPFTMADAAVARAPIANVAPGGAPLAANARSRFARERTFPAVARAGAHGTQRRHNATSSQIGSTGDVTADPLVTRPAETPCVDTLFTNGQFADYSGHAFPYAPPAGCPGPYAKIVFNADFSVNAGVQYDRTASIELGNVPIFYGTTAEPNALAGPTWHVERDVTDDAALLATAQTGEADIFNVVNSTYTGVISGTAYLQFYPAKTGIAAASTPDVVLPLPGVAGGPQAMNTGASTLGATYTLPTNIVRAYLDVYAQGQQNDEFYYTCAPNDVAAELEDCGNGPFRETEVSIDGTPAGAAPIKPWIFTGGIDPFLWTPIPGAETLEFKPYRVDLTPFAGVLSNGRPHTIAISVDNADQYFSGIATLFAYRDPGAARVTGGVTMDTLVPNPPATVAENVSGTEPQGTIDVSNRRYYEIDGYVNGSQGLVRTQLISQLNFSNEQTYSGETPLTGIDEIVQTTTDQTTVQTIAAAGTTVATTYASYPLTVKIAGAGLAEAVSMDQQFVTATSSSGPAGSYTTYASNEVKPTDVYTIADGLVTGNSAQTSTQTYEAYDSTGACYNQTLRAVSNTLLTVRNGSCSTSAAVTAARALRRTLLRR